MATTTNYSWTKPTVGGDGDAWGGYLNDNLDALDTLLGGVNATEFGILDGATITTAELNYLSGATSNIQTQIDGIVAGSSSGTVTSVSTGGGLTGGPITTTGTISHADTSTQSSVNNTGDTVIQSISVDDYGHVTSISSSTVAGYTQPTGLADVGTYAFLKANSDVTAGSTISGTNLTYSNAYGDANGSTVGVGTWRCMGSAISTTAASQRATLFLRIS